MVYDKADGLTSHMTERRKDDEFKKTQYIKVVLAQYGRYARE